MPVNENIERVIFEGVDKISSAAKSSAASTKALQQSLDSVKSALGAIGITVGIGAFVALAKDAISAQAALDDMAESTGASVEGLSAIQRVAKVGGHDFEGLTSQIGKMIKGLQSGGEEGGKTAHALKFLGVEAKNTDGSFRDTSDVLLDVAKKLSQYRDDASKVAIIQDILGKGAERYLPLLKEMAEGTDLHAKVTAAQAAAAEEAEKNIRRLGVAYDDSKRELVNGLIPAVLRYTTEILAARDATNNWYEALGAFFSISGRQGADPISAIDELNKKLESLRSLQATLSSDSWAAKWNRIVAPEDLSILSKQIADAERQRAVLIEVMKRTTFRNMEGMVEDPAGIHAAPATPRSGYKGLDEKAIAEAKRLREQQAKERQKLLDEDAKNWVRHAEEMLEISAEADKKEIALLYKNFEDARQAQLDQIDWEQNLAIQRGEEVLAAGGTAHTMKLLQLQEMMATERDAELENHRLRLEFIKQFSEEELAEWGGRDQALEDQERLSYARRLQIAKRGAQSRRDFEQADMVERSAMIFGELEAITAGVAQHNKTMFRLNQVAGIANAIISAHEGASRTLGAYPWPLAGILAAIHYAAGVARVAAIAGTTFEGGGRGAAPSVAGTAPATPVTPIEAPAQTAAPITSRDISVNVTGSRFSRDDVLELIEDMNLAFGEGANLRVTVA